MATMKGLTPLSLLALTLAAHAQDPARAERAVRRLESERESLGLDARHAFKALRSHQDELGMTHTRFQQSFNGVKVWGGQAILHQDAEGSFRPHTLAHRGALGLNTTPSLPASEALGAAHRLLAPEGSYAHSPKAELVVLPATTSVTRFNRTTGESIDREITRYTLAWHVHAEIENGADTRHADLMIDAHTGAVLRQWDSLRTSSATGTGYSQYSGTVTLNTDSTSTGYQMKDVSRAMNISTYNMANTTSSSSIYTDTDNSWGDSAQYSGSSSTSANGQTAAVDAHYGAQMTYDYFKNTHGRNGIDGSNTATYSRVHYSSNYVNAFWSDSCFCMTYGDGNTSYGYTALTSLDVAAHEMSHGVCANSADLTYSGESGGLNESNSDIFGAMVEIFARNGSSIPATVDNTNTAWTLGEQLSSSPLRYMYKPSLDGSSKDAWYSGISSLDVHYSSGPMNRCFFFLSQGSSTDSTSNYYSSYLTGGMTGLGPEKAAKIWYRTLTTYLTSSSDYAAARTGAISSAQDLYGANSTEEAAVWNAFAAINVGSAWSGGTSSDTTAPTVSASESGTSGTITLSATATDAVGVTKVEFYIDGSLVGTDTTASYSMTYASSGLSDGSHTLVAKAYDAAGNVGTSSSVSFTISNGTSTGTELIANGTFESGSTSWTSSSGVVGTFSSQPAYAGSYCAWLNGYGSKKTEYIYQKITIPSTATSATLSFMLHIDTAETTTSTAYDKLYVRIRSSSGSTLATLATYSNLHAASGYVQKTFDLSSYKGQTIQVYFYGSEDSSLQTSFVLDNTSVIYK